MTDFTVLPRALHELGMRGHTARLLGDRRVYIRPTSAGDPLRRAWSHRAELAGLLGGMGRRSAQIRGPGTSRKSGWESSRNVSWPLITARLHGSLPWAKRLLWQRHRTGLAQSEVIK